MKVKTFIDILEKNNDKELLFQYNNKQFVKANYHLTEVKNVLFDTTDCGGKTSFWKETHFQLWENPSELNKTTFMNTNKILSILNKVNHIKPLWLDTDLKFEYGNDIFSTSIMPIEKIEVQPHQVIVNLFVEATKCKANDVCGIEEKEIVKNEICCNSTNCC